MKFVLEFLRTLLQIPFLIIMAGALVTALMLFVFFDWLFNDNDECQVNGYRNSF